MKTFLTLAAGLLLAGSALASDLDFTLVNDTGRSFEGLYVSPSSDKTWNGNILANGEVLKAGASMDVKFDSVPAAAVYDINVVDDQGLAVDFDKVNLLDVKKVILKEENGQVTATVE